MNSSAYAFPTIRPLDKKLLDQIINDSTSLAVIEEHSVSGGLATEISEYLDQKYLKKRPKLFRFGLKNEYTPFSANYEILIKHHELSPDQITKKILKQL